MFKFSQLKQIHLEITNNCQASCPMCSRNIHGGIDNPLISLASWDLDMFKHIMNKEVLDQIDSYFFCGNFGDPLLNNNLLDMCEYSSTASPKTGIRIHTNGSLRNRDWWVRLAKVLPKDHLVIFAIDGLDDTHSLYRIGTDFKQVIRNATAFINAGGNAEWAFIRFKHNEHQVDTAKAQAEKLGFKKFTMKDSSRFLLEPKFSVYDKNQQPTHFLEPSTYSEIKFIDKNVIKNYRKIVDNTEIKCQALEAKEVYIDAFGQLFPCCFIAMIPYIPTNIDEPIINIREEIRKEYDLLISEFGKVSALDTKNHTIKDIIDSETYQTIWFESWEQKKLITCTRTCGVSSDFSNPRDQFIARSSL